MERLIDRVLEAGPQARRKHSDQGHQRQPLRDRDLASRDGAVARRRPEDVGELRAEDGGQPERGCEAVVHLLGVLGAEGRRRLALPTGERDRPRRL